MRLEETRDVGELCGRLHRETNAQAVLVLGHDGAILGHAGNPAALDDETVEVLGDLVVEATVRPAAADGELDEGDELRAVGDTQLCATRLGRNHVLVVAFASDESATLVRLQIKRARELILRSLDAG